MREQQSEDKIELFNDGGESRGFYSRKNRLNDLTGREWVYWSKSVINKPYPPDRQHRLRSSHGGQKPPELCADLIRVFTKEGQLVLDPFAGVGGTLLGASLAGRRAVGIELNPRWIELYREVCSREGIPEQRVLAGDSREWLPRLRGEGLACDFILTDVPYWRMDRVGRSRGKYKRVGEPQREKPRSKLSSFNEKSYPDKEAWLAELEAVFRPALPLLKHNGYLAAFIGDMYNRGEYHFLSADLARLLAGLGLTMKSNLIWYDVSKSLHVYGYLYQYIPSMIHQSVLVFRREKE
jgi:DNA modification methylase